MTSTVSASRPEAFRKAVFAFLALCWIAGLLGGFLCSYTAGPVVAARMRGLPGNSVSIVGLLGLFLLPYLISAAAVFISVPWLLTVVCFGRAFVFSYVSWCIVGTFGSAGWLFWLLILGADLLGMPVLWFYWLRNLCRGHDFRTTGTALMLCAGVWLFTLEYRILIPFADTLWSAVS